MEADWGRKTARVGISFDEILAWLRPAGMRAVGAEPLTEGHANTNVRVDLADGSRVVLRIYQRDSASRGIERAVARRWADEIPVPRVLYEGDAPRPFSVIEWRPGRTMESLVVEGEAAELLAAAPDLGRVLRQISSHRFPGAGFLGPDLTVEDPWPSTVDGLWGYAAMLAESARVAERVPPATLAEVRRVVAEAGPELAMRVGPPCLVHGDYKASNLLVHEGRVSGVLDWEFAHAGTFLLDVSQLVRHREALPPGFVEGFAEGFGDLPDDWLTWAGVIDWVNLLDFLNREECSEARRAGVVAIIERTLRGLP